MLCVMVHKWRRGCQRCLALKASGFSYYFMGQPYIINLNNMTLIQMLFNIILHCAYIV